MRWEGIMNDEKEKVAKAHSIKDFRSGCGPF
jgi:hypothetical protein